MAINHFARDKMESLKLNFTKFGKMSFFLDKLKRKECHIEGVVISRIVRGKFTRKVVHIATQH